MRGICLVVFSFSALGAYADTVVDLGTAGSFAVLAGSTVTNTGSTSISGNLGLWPGSSIAGFPPGLVNPLYTTDDDNAAAMQAQSDLTTAYNFAAGEACGTTLSGDLGGMTLTPGVYCYRSGEPSAGLTGTLTLNTLGNPDAVFIFQIASTLITATDSSVVFSVGDSQDDNVYWQVGSSATLGVGTEFQGNILALTSITLTTGATITCGSALASGGAVTMDTNTVSIDSAAGCVVPAIVPPVPEPASAVPLGMGLLGLIVYWRRSRKQAA
jgi:hypothetical protein